MKVIQRIINLKNKLYNNSITRNVIRNSSWMIGNRIFTMILGVFVTAIVARYFGPELYGKYNYALSFVTIFSILSTLGLETLSVKAIVNDEVDEGIILCTSLILRISGGIILTSLTSLTIRIVEPQDKSIHLLVFILSLSMIFKSLEVIEYWIQAYQKARVSSIVRISVYIVIAVLKVLLVAMKGNLYHYAIIYLIDIVFIGIGLIIAYLKISSISINTWKFSAYFAKSILSQSIFIIISGLMVTLYMQVDKLMLGSLIEGKTEVGVYSAAVQVAQMWYFIPIAIITSFKPIVIKKKRTEPDKYLDYVQLMYSIVAWTGLLFGIFTSIFSDRIISVLYGSEYIKAAGILTVSVWAGTFALLGVARSVWLLNEGLQKYTLIYTSVGLIINVGINIILIPKMGGHGAALATLIAQFVANVLALAMFRRTRVSSEMIIKAFSPRTVIDLARKLLT